jgi:hypothetical protein
MPPRDSGTTPVRRSPPPPPAGNLRSLKHGAFSPHLVIPDADELTETIYDEISHLTDADYPAVRDFSIAQVRAWRLAAYLERNGDFDSRGRPRPALEHLRRWLERAEKARARLGLDPVSRAALHVDQSLLVERLRGWGEKDLDEGRRLRELAKERRGRGLSGGGG